jgi:AcrR family transcriptional regulator
LTKQPSAPRRRRAQRGSGEQLRAEIIAATRQLLAEGGTADTITIRAVAVAVGVTPPSIYLHFADKQQLVDAVVADVFGELDDAMVKAAADETTPLGKLQAYGLAYIRFAVAHPEHYRVAMLDPDVGPNAESDRVVSSCFVHLQETVAECFATGVFIEGDPKAVAFDCWAVVHGVASLLITKPNVPFGPTDEFAERMLIVCALGHAASGLLGGEMTPESITEWVRMHRR